MALFNSIDLTASVGTPATHTFTTNQNVIIGFYVANTYDLGHINVTISLRGNVIAPNVEIPVESTLLPLDGKITVNAGDVLTVEITGGVGTANVSLSVLQDAIPTT